MISKGFNKESITGELATQTRAAELDRSAFQEFLAAAAEIPGVQALSQAAGLFTPEAQPVTDPGLHR